MDPISALVRLSPALPAAPRAAAGTTVVRADLGPVGAVAVSPVATVRADGRGANPAPGRPLDGRPLYGVAAYLAAGRLAADRLAAPDDRVELSGRVLGDGGRVLVARRLAGGRAVGIDAVVG